MSSHLLQQAVVYIQTADDFKQLKEGVEGCSVVGIDTEFERTRTYWPDLCLLQIGTPSTVFVVEPHTFDLTWLNSFLQNAEITKIFHSCRQDQEAFYAFSGVMFQNLFDTQVAAALVGMGDQISYADLCQQLLEVQLSKDLQWSDWAKRPLLPEQISYAANDVRYLIELHQILEEKLKETGREELMRNIMCAYEDKINYHKDVRRYFMNKCYQSSLSIEQNYALYQLIEWREQYCQTHNVIRRLVFEDKDLERMLPTLAYDDFLPEHPMRETFYQVIKGRQEDEGRPNFLKAQHIIGHAIKAIDAKIRKTLGQLGVPMHYVVSQDMIFDFLLEPSHENNPLFNSWRYGLLEDGFDKLLMIKSKFQAQQNQCKTSHKNIG